MRQKAVLPGGAGAALLMLLPGWQLLICTVPTSIGAFALGGWQWFWGQ